MERAKQIKRSLPFFLPYNTQRRGFFSPYFQRKFHQRNLFSSWLLVKIWPPWECSVACDFTFFLPSFPFSSSLKPWASIILKRKTAIFPWDLMMSHSLHSKVQTTNAQNKATNLHKGSKLEKVKGERGSVYRPSLTSHPAYLFLLPEMNISGKFLW